MTNFPVLLLAVLLSSGSLLAAPNDAVQAYVSTSITHDDNLLRLSRDVDPLTISGQPSGADTIKQGTLGIKADLKQSRQEVILDASISESRFSRFTSLNFQGKNFQLRWNWQLADSLSGNIGYNKNTSLGSFAEQQRLNNNLSTQQNEFINVAWQLRPSLRLNSGLTLINYSVTGDAVNSNDSISYSAGAYFTPPSGNEIGVQGIHLIQKFPILQIFSGVPVDNGFTQDQLLATLNWLYSGHIRFNGQAGLVSRTHNQLEARDFSGSTMRGTLTWLASGKSQVNLVAWNEIDGNDNLTTSFTRSRGISLAPTWVPTDKLSVSARLQYSERDFLGDPSLQLSPGLLTPTRRDRVNLASLSVNYQPMRNVNIASSIQSERRNSNEALADYVSNSVNLNASFGF